MNIHTFDNHYVGCPICQRNAKQRLAESHIGLFTCPYCQQRLVVCRSGHYVRDPFMLKQIMLCSSLRRQSSPLARIIRDFILIKRPILSLAVGLAIFLTMMTVTQENTNYDPQFPSTEKTQDGK
ncbi:hypothetical protein [Umezakia ovalisporum]|jgi:hypothetical protein|uniref:Uncharacterized protein n=2 Tax=Umezakia ovalisporum TaxID=75695 RepID=A0AA43H0C9_9CYAN|nr:hypothetical protein [Umezakia ovalisporum]MBI1242965.1 hypothetical protein [Nostoc sp. RI_552]MDH6058713.1 hypothetical protein [Umezakia ovalisporum FSS-43]MDH6065134.1 hypothetical protein [Umezakia ovalisporum FSS-62]MDH6065810.1 hypothetical protein [Umezakia ovalisporum APH033B]MDH6069730.1 hypothetical protein [Umezakia ovalisporum CobakiLakeA]